MDGAPVRIIGDRIFEQHHGGRWSPLEVPTTPSPTSDITTQEADALPRRVVIESAPGGPITIHPADYYRRLPQYEALARARQLPVRAVWLIVHESEDGLRGATGITRALEGQPPEHTIWLNVARTRCALHRLYTFTHEAEHIRRGHCLPTSSTSSGYTREQEEPCDSAGAAEVRAALEIAAAAEPVVDKARCQACCDRGAEPCPQGAKVFEAVNRALAPL